MSQPFIEKPFEYLRRKNGDAFSDETINNWYVARAYVLEKLKNVAIGMGSDTHLHAIVTGDSPMMLSVARQVALSAHYANFDERHPIRTVITIVSNSPQLVEELQKEEYLCNLPLYCKLSVNGEAPKNEDSYLDIELHVVETQPEDNTELTIIMSEEDVKAFLDTKNKDDIFGIDTRKAVMTDRMYALGTWIDNLPAEDIHSAKRYAMALNVFQHSLLRHSFSPLVKAKQWESNPSAVKNGLSNIFCSDCFASRAAGVRQYAKTHGITEAKAWEECVEALSKSEHARWATDKLIMGFRPLSLKERLQDECSFGKEKEQYRSQLKKNAQDPVHIDLCSFAELRRINPSDLKYDSFLTLAIPRILKQCQP